jgi:membrane protease YdiL (CAAX protease family)
MKKNSKFMQKTRVLLWIVWVVVSFFVATYLTVGLVWLLRPLLGGINDSVLLETLFGAVVYVLLLLVAVGVPYVVFKYDKKQFLALLGLNRRPKWNDLGRAAVSFLAYYGILFTVIAVLTVAAGAWGFDIQSLLNEEQNIGFAKTGNSSLQLFLIFISLAIIPPICEEVVMRGFLFGKLSQKLKFWPAAILTSLVFAVAHGQWNVAIDTFVLSMVLCYLRVSTGSLWAGVIVHIFKNSLAFVLLFTNIIKIW